MEGELIWVSLSYATFGVLVKDQFVVDAAPIGRWMIGKTMRYVRIWVRKKGGDWVVAE